MNQKATLYIVPTPIGNLEDITFRAVKVLKSVSVVFAEDTRTSKRLFSHYDIDTPMRSYHAFNEHQKTEELVSIVESGSDVAIISDAGTPGISDPAFLAIQAAIESGVHVECLPGATAFVPALLISGFPNHRFAFYGFPPHKKGRKKFISEAVAEDKTVIFYESPYRLLKLLEQILEEAEENRQIAVVREISKIHEECVRGNISEVLDVFKSKRIRGEFVVVIEGKS